MRQTDALGVEWPWDVMLGHLTRMGGWLHLVTVLLTLCKWAGMVHASWWIVFLPSLLYGTLIVLLGVLSEAFLFSRYAEGSTPQTSRLLHPRSSSSSIATGFSVKRDKAA